jgi:hypothetical protein
MEAVMVAVHRGIEQLSGSAGPTQNAANGAIKQQGYAMPAHTREDVLQATPNIAQVPSDNPAPQNQHVVQQAVREQNNDMFAMLAGVADPTTRQLGHGIPGEARPQPMQQAPMTANGLVLPPGTGAQPVAPAPSQDDANIEWLA